MLPQVFTRGWLREQGSKRIRHHNRTSLKTCNECDFRPTEKSKMVARSLLSSGALCSKSCGKKLSRFRRYFVLDEEALGKHSVQLEI